MSTTQQFETLQEVPQVTLFPVGPAGRAVEVDVPVRDPATGTARELGPSSGETALG